METWDAVVVGGGPAGATAATELALGGRRVLLLDRAGRVKPCGGAIPPRLIADFAIPDSLLVARIRSARIVSPSNRKVDMHINGGFVGMVDRCEFDEWLRERAAGAGARRRTGTFERVESRAGDSSLIHYTDAEGKPASVAARAIIGADGARSAVARQCLPAEPEPPSVFAYHEIVRTPEHLQASSGTRCDVIYRGGISPDFYGWVFPHGSTTSVGSGTAVKGFAVRRAVESLRAGSGLGDAETIRREGAPIPLRPRGRWDNGRDLVLAGDAAGVVAPASGEGIYYAMLGGRLAAEAVEEFLESGDPKTLRQARRRFMSEHGTVFRVLGLMQRFWYASDKRRERFVRMCEDPDVQELTWQAYMHKRLVRAKPMAHVRIFFKDLAHLLGLVRA